MKKNTLKERKMTKIISICNQKGGVGKTTTTINLGVGLAGAGFRVLLIDADSQANLTTAMGFDPEEVTFGLPEVIDGIINEQEFVTTDAVLSHKEGVDILPSHIGLSNTEVRIFSAMNRERLLRTYLEKVKYEYDYILIDCMPSLGMMTINALTASDSVIIPCQPHYLSARGLEQLSHTIAKVKRYMNPDLRIEGILLTMVDNRGKFVKEISSLLRSQYGESINIYKSEIPLSVRAAESSAEGRSIYAHDKFGKVANAYKELTKEVIHGAENKRRKNKAENVR